MRFIINTKRHETVLMQNVNIGDVIVLQGDAILAEDGTLSCKGDMCEALLCVENSNKGAEILHFVRLRDGKMIYRDNTHTVYAIKASLHL